MQSANKQILLLGSGYMSESVAEYMLRRSENHLIVASVKLSEAQAICKKFSRCEAVALNVTNQKELLPLVERADLVISYVPAFLHPHVARACITAKKNLVTASYVSPEMAAFDAEAKSKGLVFLNELGVDPGIDHMATMKIVDEVKAHKGRILDYYSYCGGLPSPQDTDNPFGYKFSWSPIGALRALKNSAKFQKDGKIITIPSSDLLFCVEEVRVNNAVILESYPNRDSIQYTDIYGMKETENFLRGTLRYKGYSLIMRSFVEVGFMSESEIPYLKEITNWRQLVQRVVEDARPDEKTSYLNDSDRKNLVARAGLDPEASKTADRILRVAFSNKQYSSTKRETLIENGAMLLAAIKWLGFFDETLKMTPGKTYLEVLCSLLEAKLKYMPGETDAIYMQHIFKIDWRDKLEIRKSTMVFIGEKGKKSAMAITVGYPTGIGAQLILDGKITTPGVVIPTKKEIYEPIMARLEENGISLKEHSEFIFKPKL